MARHKNSVGLWNIRTLVFLIAILFLVVQIAFLTINIYLYAEDPKVHVEAFLDWFLDHGVKVPLCDENIILSPSLNQDASTPSSPDSNDNSPLRSNSDKDCIIRKSGDYLAIPVTINLVLILADILLIWATAARIKLWLWPWMILHTIELLFFITLLVLLMVLIDEPWIKVVIFLIGCPVIILLSFFLFVINCFYSYLQDLTFKEAVSNEYAKSNSGMPSSFSKRIDNNPPPTMYTTEPPHAWDQPPIWAINPPQTVWDPEYLQKLDPRYNSDLAYGRNYPRPSSRSAPTNRKLQNRPEKIRGVEAILPDGTIVVPLVDEDEYVEEYEEDYDNDPRWYNQRLEDFRGRYPRASLSNGQRHEYSGPNERINTHREISTKALTKSSKFQRQPDTWDDDDTYPEYENHGFEEDLPPPHITYNKHEQRNKSSRYANVNIHHHEFSQSSRNVSENEFDDVASNRHNWATSSVPGSLSGKYGNGDQIIEENESLGNLEDDAITKKDTNKHPKRKPAKPISDDGVITTISQQEGASNDDKCSSVMSLSDKYRTQEEIEIFQENFHYKPPPDPVHPNAKTNQASSERSASTYSSSNTKNTDLPGSDKQSSEDNDPNKEDEKDIISDTNGDKKK